jgi:hypothetical protein
VFRRLGTAISPHRRTIVRVALGCVVVAVGLFAVGGAIRMIRAEDRPSTSAPASGTPSLTWTARVPGAVSGLAQDGGSLYVSGRQLTIFPTTCPTVDGACTMSWHATVPDGPLSAPVVRDGRVFVGSASGQVYAFPAVCEASGCPPEWVGVAGEGPVSRPAVNDDFVYVTSDRLYAFPAGCATEDLACPPAWSAEVPGGPAAGPPAIGGGLVLVGSASTRGGVMAFPAVCAEGCRPVWTGRTDGPATSVTIGGGLAYVVARGQLWAFPLSCVERCRPQWRGSFLQGAPFATGATEAPTPAGDRVLVADDVGWLWVFPATCEAVRCEPLASLEIGASGLHSPVADGSVAAVTSALGRLAIVDLACGSEPTAAPSAASPSGPSASPATPSAGATGDPCEPVRSQMLGATSGAAPALGDEVVYAANDRGTVLALPRS